MPEDRTEPGFQSLEEVTITLTDDESDRLRNECVRSLDALRAVPLDREELLTGAELVGCRLPEPLLRELSRFRNQGNGYGGLVIRNLPIDRELPCTPAHGRLVDWGAVPLATCVQLAIASRLGEAIAYADEKDGSLVQDIVPVRNAEERQENTGTVFLELHTEDGFHPYRPHFITLLCLRPDRERLAYTLLASAARVLRLLPRDCLRILREPLFRIRVSTSFAGSRQTMSAPMPVLSGPDADPDMVVDFHAMQPQTPAAGAALEKLKAALIPSLGGVALETGDLIVIDNRVAIHGRTAFSAHHDGADRWLRRCFSVTDLRPSRGVRPAGSRVLAPLDELGMTVTGENAPLSV